MALNWHRNPTLDTWKAYAPEGTYFCMRTAFDVAVLYLDDKELRRSGSDGSHTKNRDFAEKHHADLQNAKEST